MEPTELDILMSPYMNEQERVIDEEIKKRNSRRRNDKRNRKDKYNE